MNNKNIIAFLTLPVITGGLLASASLTPVYASQDECNAEVDLQGTVSRNVATVTNHSQNDSCVYDATLAVYDSPKEPETYGWIEAQKLIASKSVSVKAGETITITVDGSGPSCYYQSDLIRGKEVFETPYYRNAMDVDVYQDKSTCKNEEVTPTPTTTPNNETKTETKVTEKLASTGDIALVYSFILAGFATLAAGLFLRKAGK